MPLVLNQNPAPVPKWQRNFTMKVDGRMPQKTVNGVMVADPDSQVSYGIAMPMTVEFDIDRRMCETAQYAHFKIYNLQEATRRGLYHVQYELGAQWQQGITFFAGYDSQGSAQHCLFAGQVWGAGSYRSGPDWITEIEAFDGDIGMSGDLTLTAPAGSNPQALIKALTAKLNFVQFGACGNITYEPKRSVSFMGNPLDVINRIRGVGGVSYIDNRNLYSIDDSGEYVVKPGSRTLVINSDSIIGSPKREGSMITVVTLLEPSVFIGEGVQLSSADQDYNGTWQVRGIQHKGVISGSVCGDAFTTLSLWTGMNSPVAVQAVR